MEAELTDLLVIGGGVNGTGAFRDAALRGLRCTLLEQHDYAAGASGNSSGMIHGGVRYLTEQPRVTRASCLDSGRIQRIVPHLLFRIPFLFPVPRDHRFARLLLLGMDGFFEAYDRYQPLKRGLPHERLSPQQALALEPGLHPEIAGAVTFDEWGIDGHRLCWLNVRSGIDAGGTALNHLRVEALEPLPQGGWLVQARGRLDGRLRRYQARAVLNAAGAWGPGVAGLADAPYRLRPAKGVHLVFDRRLSNFSLTATALDGRSVFLEPWQNVSILGTTDDDYFGDLDDVPVTHDEAEYLLASLETVYPAVRQGRLIDAWAGIRPTLYAYGPNEDDLSREHEIIDHGARHGRPGLFSLAGGKLASYRALAEEALDTVSRFLQHSAPCRTADLPLPGGETPADPDALVARWGIHPLAARRLAYRHGALADSILADTERRPAQRRPICRCEPVLEAEIRWAAREEQAATLDDLRHRTRIGTGPCGAARCTLAAATVLADARGLPAAWARQEADRFLEARYRSRRPIVRGPELRADAVARLAARSR